METLLKYASMVAITTITLLSSCKDSIYDNIKNYSKEEIIYPAAFDTVYASIGYERAEIDLRKDGRLPASKLDLSKAVRTVVVYDEDSPNPQIQVIDSVCSYVNVTGLTEPRLYRFKIYTEDEYGNKSIPQNISLVPYTKYDLEVLKQGILEPTLTMSPNSLVMEWSTGLHTILMEYHGLSYAYTDQSGTVHEDSVKSNPRIFSTNLPAGQEVEFDMKYKVLPILENGDKLIDTVVFKKPYTVKMPTADQPFIPQESNILRANGIKTFNTEAVSGITSLTYPMNMTTFADLFYFPNIEELDLTGKGLDGILETTSYAKNNQHSIVGGGRWQEFMMPVDKPAVINAPAGLQTLKDLLDAGQIKHMKYIPKSLGTAFDSFIAPYVSSGVVELLTDDHPFFPQHVFVDPQFFANGKVQDNNWEMNVSYSGTFLPRAGLNDIGKFNAQNDQVNGQSVDLHLDQLIQQDGTNIYRAVVVGYRPSFFFALPRQWRFDNKKYRYLKFKVLIGSDPSLVSNVGGNNRHVYRAPWIRPMNRLWGFAQYSDYGQEYWDAGRLPSQSDSEIQNTWKEYTVDMSGNDGGDNSNRRNRVYVVNFGHEDGVTWTYDKNNEIVMYVADFRLCKTAND